MDIKKSTIIALLLGAMMIFLTSCPEVCIDPVYTFGISGQFSPEKDSIRVGDTLFLNFRFSTNLRDLQSGQMIDYSKAENLAATLRVTEFIKGETLAKGAVNAFLYHNVTGSIYNNASVPNAETVQQLRFVEANGFYHLEVGLIPKKWVFMALA
ncbi:MAG: hypothetical protein HC880_20935 [Bacteroidia bacterium]|nr:hypothetical protein [Bacteroidia bacterium]